MTAVATASALTREEDAFADLVAFRIPAERVWLVEEIDTVRHVCYTDRAQTAWTATMTYTPHPSGTYEVRLHGPWTGWPLVPVPSTP